MNSVGSHGSSSLPFVMKVMVCHFVSDSHEVMTALIFMLPLIVVVEISLQLHQSIFFRENAEEFLCVSVAENKPSYIPSGLLEGSNVRASQGASSALKFCISYFLITSSVHATHQCCITQLLYLHFLDLQRLI
jgi:hypothetical protein